MKLRVGMRAGVIVAAIATLFGAAPAAADPPHLVTHLVAAFDQAFELASTAAEAKITALEQSVDSSPAHRLANAFDQLARALDDRCEVTAGALEHALANARPIANRAAIVEAIERHLTAAQADLAAALDRYCQSRHDLERARQALACAPSHELASALDQVATQRRTHAFVRLEAEEYRVTCAKLQDIRDRVGRQGVTR